MSRLDAGTVKVVGLDEFRKELRKLDDAGIIDGLKDANYEVARIVVAGAQGRASTPMQRGAAASLKPSRQAARAQVTGGGARVPYFGGAEFGAQQNQLRLGPSGRTYRGLNQFSAWRGSDMSAGYFLYPAIRDLTDRIVEIYGDAIEQLTKQAFPDQ